MSDTEFEVMVIKIIIILEKRVDELSNNDNKHM